MIPYKRFYILLFSTITTLHAKVIMDNTPASSCLKAVSSYLAMSDFLSPELKKACTENLVVDRRGPVSYNRVGVCLVSLLYYGSQRPEEESVQQAQDNLSKRNPAGFCDRASHGGMLW